MTDYDLQTLADKQAVADVIATYAIALDSRDWHLLERCFTPDATTDYGEFGGRNADRDEIVETCQKALVPIGSTQHLIANVLVDVDGDSATATSYLHGLHATKDTPGGDVCMIYGIYRDNLVRTAQGWQIRHKQLEFTWVDGNLDVMTGVTTHTEAKA